MRVFKGEYHNPPARAPPFPASLSHSPTPPKRTKRSGSSWCGDRLLAWFNPLQKPTPGGLSPISNSASPINTTYTVIRAGRPDGPPTWTTMCRCITAGYLVKGVMDNKHIEEKKGKGACVEVFITTFFPELDLDMVT